MKKATATTLPSPCTLEEEKKKGDGSKAVIAFFTALQEKIRIR
jgi:hypothetical protein